MALPSSKYLFVGILLLGAFLLGSFLGSSRREIVTFSRSNKDIQVAKNEVKNLRRALLDVEEENTALQETIQGLLSIEPEIKYIVEKEVVLVGGQDTYQELPNSYTYMVNGVIPVGEFLVEEDQYQFLTHDLTFETNLVIGGKASTAMVSVRSSKDPSKTYRVESDLDVTRIRNQKLFEPHIGAGISFHMPDLAPTGSIYVPLIHPSPDIDLLSPRISMSKTATYLGVDLIGYNVGSRVPVLTDLWIYGGVSSSLDLTPQVTITIGSKF